MKKLFAAALAVLAMGAYAAVDQSWPLMIIADESGVPIEGVSKSTDKANVLEKVLNLGPGTYKVMRPDATITITTDTVEPPVVDPEPVEPEEPPVIDPPTSMDGGIVYTRVPRTIGDHTVTLSDGSAYTSDKWDYLDGLPEVSRQFSGFNAPGQLVLRVDGTEKVIYDCMDSPRPCVPFDAMPSLDGKKIAFSVYSSDSLKPPWPENRNYPNRQLSSVGAEAQIFIYDIASESLTAWPHTAGVHDISPVWLPDGRMLFGSTRNGFFAPWLNKIGSSKASEPRLYIADINGSNVVDISPHEVTAALHPYLLDSGRIAYSSQWLSHNLAYGTANGSINWPGTTSNFWPVVDMDLRGGDATAIFGAHKGYVPGANPRDAAIKAMHFLGQLNNGDVCGAHYYRGNNLGLGSVLCWTPEPVGVEGPTPKFYPSNTYSLAAWSTSNDQGSLKDADGDYMGKLGWPEGLPDGQALVSFGKGYCTQVSSVVPGVNDMLSAADQIGCDVGIYKTTVIPSTSPDDLAVIVDHPEWHEFGARVVKSRQIAAPPIKTTPDGSCQLASSDAGATDALHYGEYNFNHEMSFIDNDGSLMETVDHSELSAIRFYEVTPNTSKAQVRNSIGNPVKLLGDAPLLADKSFKVQLPCDTPYIMAGVDSDGRLIKRDQIPQSLRPGEKRVCSGCHLHSEKGRPYEQSMAFTAPPLPLLNPEPVPTYTNDIKPIFEARCSSCHTDDVPLFDYEKLVWDYLQQSVPEGKRVVVDSAGWNEARQYGLQRPMTSKYVNSMYARESLLYWKAANRRTDGRSDDTYTNDIDFGADHHTETTAVELKAIGDWLDSGAGL